MSKSLEFDAWAYFKITSDLPLSAIEEVMGAKGEERSWSKGDIRSKKAPGTFTFSSWKLQSGLEKGESIDDHLRSLWRRLALFRPKFPILPPEMITTVQCVGHFNSRNDPFSIASGHYKTVAFYGCEFDCDFYFMDEFGNEEEDGQPLWSW